MPKSKNTALATILPPIVLGTEAIAVLPSSVLQFKFKLSSLLLIIGVLGMGASIDILLFVNWHVPELPSLKDIDIGTNASLVIEAHEPKVMDAPIIKDRFTMILSNLNCCRYIIVLMI